MPTARDGGSPRRGAGRGTQPTPQLCDGGADQLHHLSPPQHPHCRGSSPNADADGTSTESKALGCCALLQQGSHQDPSHLEHKNWTCSFGSDLNGKGALPSFSSVESFKTLHLSHVEDGYLPIFWSCEIANYLSEKLCVCGVTPVCRVWLRKGKLLSILKQPTLTFISTWFYNKIIRTSY